ncbi:MAG: hypothetical protein Q9169_007634 [Polycauliona sp. 2 TL-2023]
MAHISGLLQNRARAQSYLAMIPEARRKTALEAIEKSLGKTVEHSGSPSPITRPIVDTPDLAAPRMQSRLPLSSPGLHTHGHRHGSESMASQASATALWSKNQVGSDDLRSVTVTSLVSAGVRSNSSATDRMGASDDFAATPEAFSPAALSPNEPPKVNPQIEGSLLSRREILDKIGCHPKDRIEEVVCDGDYSAFAIVLNKRNGWRSKFRKYVRPERVTALHFAALFGEIAMAQQLLGSGFDVNEIPFGYSTSLTPLKFAIGARQVDMVDFLIRNGAKPSDTESWSSLGGQLMNRSWLSKTMSEAEREFLPGQMIAILKILLKQGWNPNEPLDKTSGGTVLHQAVAFWTGSYRLDMNLRVSMTSFLCERGADPCQANKDGKTPYEVALASGHQDLLLILDQHSGRKEMGDGRPEPAELSSEPADRA